jgi:protein-disulfide isomerase
MQKESKIITLISVITVAIIGLGIYFLTKTPKDETKEPTAQAVDKDRLIKDNSSIIKAPKEKVTLVEFGDFQCPACAAYHDLVSKMIEEYKENLTFVFRHFPLLQHQNARPAAYAAEAAGKQGKFWEMYDLLYVNQSEWSEEKDTEEIFVNYATKLELNIDKFKSEMDSKEIKDKVSADYSDGVALKVNSTPSFFLNGQKISLPGSLEGMRLQIDSAIENYPVSGSEPATPYHAHFDFKVIADGKEFDFSESKYQESKDNPLDADAHFHDGNGKIVHLHKRDISLGQFLQSLKFTLTKTCLITDPKTSYCSGGDKTLKVFVNEKENTDYENYIPKDLDRILITYGKYSESELQYQIDSVSDESCIYSEKCPERGPAPKEECVGGLGTECEE